MVDAQSGWSQQQKKFLDSLGSEPGAVKHRRTTAPSAAITSADDDDDPEEIDISNISVSGNDAHAKQREDLMRRMVASSQLHGAAGLGDDPSEPLTDAQDPFGILRQMQAMQPPGRASNGQMPGNPFAMLQQMQQSADAGGSGSAEDFGGDPFAMMQQMMGSMAGPDGQGMKMPGVGQMPQSHASIPARVDAKTRIWRLIHIASMLLLLLLLDTSSLPTLGTRHAPGTVFRASGVPLFWYFVTVELVLQTTRLLLHGPSPQPSFINQLAQFLPPPYAGYVLLLTRYSQILTTMKDDFLVLIFGLGACAWWNA